MPGLSIGELPTSPLMVARVIVCEALPAFTPGSPGSKKLDDNGKAV